MRATRLNHVSISARDLEESAQFHETLFGMERLPSPTFDVPVCWLRVGDVQLHLFLDDSEAPQRHHVGLTVDDFDAAYHAVKQRLDDPFGLRIIEPPSGQVQLYLRDPAGNLVELNWPDAATLDRSRYPELQRLDDQIPQAPGAEAAALFV